MWDLDDQKTYFRLFSVIIRHAYTWGGGDRDKREDIRKAAVGAFPASVPAARWWAFRLYARKTGAGWDIENIPKLVVDAFSTEQITKDGSKYPQVRIYEKDTIEYVRMVQVAGEQDRSRDALTLEVFGRK